MAEKKDWIPDLEIENAQIKWNFSHFDGREDTYNREGDYNFTVIIPDVAEADALRELGWAIKELPPYEDGDEPEHILKVNVSDKFGVPKMYLIKSDRKFRIEELRELRDIKRVTTEQIDLVLQPSRWVNGANTGISAYVKELYAKIRTSRFDDKYSEYEEV